MAPDFTTAVAAREGVVLDPGALTLLSILNNSGTQRPSALAKRMITGASNISKVSARLQEAGLVEQSCDPKDARASLIGLTKAGRRAGTALQHSGISLIDELLSAWSAEDRSNLLRLLSRFEAESSRVAAILRDPSIPTGKPASGRGRGFDPA